MDRISDSKQWMEQIIESKIESMVRNIEYNQLFEFMYRMKYSNQRIELMVRSNASNQWIELRPFLKVFREWPLEKRRRASRAKRGERGAPPPLTQTETKDREPPMTHTERLDRESNQCNNWIFNKSCRGGASEASGAATTRTANRKHKF